MPDARLPSTASTAALYSSLTEMGGTCAASHLYRCPSKATRLARRDRHGEEQEQIRARTLRTVSTCSQVAAVTARRPGRRACINHHPSVLLSSVRHPHRHHISCNAFLLSRCVCARSPSLRCNWTVAPCWVSRRKYADRIRHGPVHADPTTYDAAPDAAPEVQQSSSTFVGIVPSCAVCVAGHHGNLHALDPNARLISLLNAVLRSAFTHLDSDTVFKRRQPHRNVSAFLIDAIPQTV